MGLHAEEETQEEEDKSAWMLLGPIDDSKKEP